MPRITGTVKWFSDAKGYGFIERDDGGDIFVHHTSIEGSGFKTLKEGTRVEFDVLEEDKGPKAQNVTEADAAAAPGVGGQAGHGSSHTGASDSV